MRIGINCFMLQPHVGGLKQYCLTLLDELLSCDRKNEYVLFYFPQNVEQLTLLRNGTWRRNAVLLNNQDEINDHLGRIDLYFCPFGALWPRPVPIPSAVTLVDIQEVFYPDFFTPMDLFNRDYHFRGSVRMAETVITISEFSKRTIVQHYGVPESRVKVSHLCADPRYYRAAEVGVSPQRKLPAGAYAVFPANRWPHKNHDVLLKAMCLLKERGTRVDVVFTGYDMPGGFPLAQKAFEYGIDDQVHVMGYVTLEEMAYLYTRARMLVFPSLFEGFGIPLVEAMAAGCPVVSSHATSLPEIGLDAAEYFDPVSAESAAAAIEKVWKDRTRRAELIAAGRSRARDFSPSRMADAHLAAFGDAASQFRNARYWWHYFGYRHIHRTAVFFKHRKTLMADRQSDGVSLDFTSGWHQREQDGPDWLRWTGGVGAIAITTRRAGTLEVTGEVVSIQRPNDVEIRLNGNRAATWRLEEDAFQFKAFEPLLLNTRAGRNTIEFVSRNPAIKPPGDERELAIAVRNLSVRPVAK